jgi:hypothetical protein
MSLGISASTRAAADSIPAVALTIPEKAVRVIPAKVGESAVRIFWMVFRVLAPQDIDTPRAAEVSFLLASVARIVEAVRPERVRATKVGLSVTLRLWPEAPDRIFWI